MSRATSTSTSDPLAGLPRWGTEQEYLDLDERSPYPLEYFGSRDHPGWGEIVVRGAGDGPLAMAGGTDEHSIITVNLSASLWTRLRGGPCVVFSPDKRIGSRRDPTYAYPDVSVVCGPIQNVPADGRVATAVNPVLIFEVLSPTTEREDRGRKFDRYFEAESLQEYVLVAQNQPRLESYFRQADGTWSFSYAVGLDGTLRLRSVGVDLPLADVYLNVTFPPPRTIPLPVGDNVSPAGG